MPEHWEREVGKLATLTAPRSVRPRIGEGPHDDGMPPRPRRGQRVAAAAVALAVFGVATVFVAGAFQRSDPFTGVSGGTGSSVVIHLRSDNGPAASLEYAGETVEPQVGSYCWAEAAVGRCVDTVLTPFDGTAFVTSPAGTRITIDGDDTLRQAVVKLEPGSDPNDILRRSDLSAPVTEMDSTEGRYTLWVSASWPEGDVSFYFPVEIVGATSPTPSPNGSGLTAVLDAPSDGSMPELAITYRGSTQRFFAQDGRWPGVDGFTGPLQLFDVSIDPGTTISIESDADHVDGSLFVADRELRATGGSIPLDLASGSATLPDAPGYYRLTVVGTWPRGSAGFSIGITIGTPPSDWPPPPSTATVPDVIGLGKHEAVGRLTDAGFQMVSVANPAGETTGVVASQDPPPGTRADITTVISLTVSPSG
jgi:PASTA domain